MAGSCRVGLLDQKRVDVRIRDATAPAARPAKTATFSCADQTTALVWLTPIKNKTLTLNTLLYEPNWALSMMTLTAFFLRGLKQRLQWEILGKYQVPNSCLDSVSQIRSICAGCRLARQIRPSVIGATCTFWAKSYRIVDRGFSLSVVTTGSKRIFDFSCLLGTHMF